MVAAEPATLTLDPALRIIVFKNEKEMRAECPKPITTGRACPSASR